MTYVPTAWADGDCVMAADMNHIEHGIDIAQGDVMVLHDLTANIPATDPELVGRLFIETDGLLRTWRDNGAGWDLAITPGGGALNLIQAQVLGAPAATVTFAAIPGTYRTAVLRAKLRTDRVAGSDNLYWRANGDSGNNYDWMVFRLYENVDVGAAMRAQPSARIGGIEASAAVANTFSSCDAYWDDYASVTKTKQVLTRTGIMAELTTDATIQHHVGYSGWRSTAAITSLTFLPEFGPNFITGCIFALYGIT